MNTLGIIFGIFALTLSVMFQIHGWGSEVTGMVYHQIWWAFVGGLVVGSSLIH